MKAQNSPIFMLSDDVFMLIFLELYRGDLTMQDLRRIIPSVGQQGFCWYNNLHQTPTDPVSIATCSRVCRRWAGIIHGSNELQSSIILTLPLTSKPPVARVRIDDPRHIARFLELEGRDSSYPINVRIYTHQNGLSGIPPNGVTSFTDSTTCLLPLMDSARCLVLHGPAFPGQFADLRFRELQVLVLSDVQVPNLGFEVILRTYSSIKVFKILHGHCHKVSWHEARPLHLVASPITCPYLEYFEFVGRPYEFLAVLRTMILERETHVVFHSVHPWFKVLYENGLRQDIALTSEQLAQAWPLKVKPAEPEWYEALVRNCRHLRRVEFESLEDTELLSRLFPTRHSLSLVELHLTGCLFDSIDLAVCYDRICDTAKFENKPFSSLVIRDCDFENNDASQVFSILQDKVFSLEVIDTRVGFSQRTMKD